MKLAITGATGFIGGNFFDRFREQFKKINVLTREPKADLTNVSYVCGSLASADSLDRLTQDIDVVLHCAFDGTYSYNVSGIKHLLNSCEQNGVRRLVHLSSYAVYDFSGATIDESTPYASRWDLYTREKIALEQALRHHLHRPCSLSIIQPTIVFGPGSNWSNSSFLATKHSQIALPEAGQNICNAIYIDDLVEILMQQIQITDSNTIHVQLASNIQTTWESFLKFHAEALHQKGYPVNKFRCTASGSRNYADSALKNFIFQNSGRFPLKQLLGPLVKRKEGRPDSFQLATPLIDTSFSFNGTARMCQSFSQQVISQFQTKTKPIEFWLERFCNGL